MRYLLLPISGAYALVIFIRNRLFDRHILPSQKVPKSIGVGNLSMGGTGKSPLSIYLAEFLLKNHYLPALLSRGYGRVSKGFIEVQRNALSISVGDEPLMFKQRFKTNAHVFVCENRINGTEKIRNKHPESVIIYDDIFQHRKVNPSFLVLTTPYNDMFLDDHILPVGRLREPISSAKRADVVMITKSPQDISDERIRKIKQRFERFEKPIFFSSVTYGNMVPFEKQNKTVRNILLVTGIADPSHLINHLENKFSIETISFSDHHVYTASDLNKIHEKFGTFDSEETIILTTEKDMVRLSKFKALISKGDYPWYYQPMNIHIREESDFQSLIKKHVREI